MMGFKQLFLLLMIMFISACSATFQNKVPVDQVFPSVQGYTLSGDEWRIPEDFQDEIVVLLIGYKQKSQFDIDRWMIGLDQRGVKAEVFELPVIQGFLPRLFAKQIDAGMRSGIPDELWRVVITVYNDSLSILDFLGNEDPLNARVLVLGKRGRVMYFHDRGFSVFALNELLAALPPNKKTVE